MEKVMPVGPLRRIEASRQDCVRSQGFTLMEMLIVITLIMLICLIVLANIYNQIAKAHDGQRKTDLHKIQTSFEEYYNDNVTYPPDFNALSNCGGAGLAPYLAKIPCDPVTKKPYVYVLGNPTPKDGYVVCAKLENQADPDITRIGCDPVQGCGWALGYNYCVASGMLAVAGPGGGGGGGGGGGTSGTPTPTAQPGTYACTPDGDCNSYSDLSGCPVTFADRYCLGRCTDVKIRCNHY